MQPAVAFQYTDACSSRQSALPESSAWFNIVSADSPALLDLTYRLRYQVYCLERGYEAVDAYPDQRETDQYDSNSAHSLLVSSYDNTLIGTVRLVLANHNDLENSFPMQHIGPLSNVLHGSRPFSLSRTAEISRFAISKSGRKVPQRGAGSPGNRSRKPVGSANISAPSIMLGLMRATMRMSHEHGITDWLAVMEPTLLRLLSRFGIYFQPIGPMVEYHGFRQPCYANVHLLLERMRCERPDVWGYITDEGRFLGSR
jgi:N-acyl amino acid synthase of PEP-CTERM/exosortase system